MINKWITKMQAGQPLSETESFLCLQTLFNSDETGESALQLLRAVSSSSENTDTLVGFCRAIQHEMIRVSLPKKSIDVCGTGGSGKIRFNTSTASAFVCASMGINVAKHGNRGSKQANGSFDFLEALDIPFGQSPDCLEKLITDEHLCFIFARQHHPQLAKFADARKTIGARTIFNLIGPLCNPGNLNYQIIGTTDLETASVMAEARQRLGTIKTIFVVGANGLDELSTTGPSSLITVTSDKIETHSFNPKNIGFAVRDESEIQGGDSRENASLFLDIIQNKDASSPIAELIILNAGLASYCIGNSTSIKSGVEAAKNAIESGQVETFFNRYQEQSQKCC